MKGYYLFAPVESGCVGAESGVERKIRAQHRAIKEFLDCELVILPYESPASGNFGKLYRRMPFTAAWRKWKYRGEFDDANFIYIRKVYEDSTFIHYLAEIKRNNPKVKIIYEVPTYPEKYNTPLSIGNFSFRAKQKFAQKQLRFYVDAIVTFYQQDEIYNIPCIKTINGYDFSEVVLPERQKSDTIEILSVAVNAYWHGYDRLIDGIKAYYDAGGKERIVYHVVGTPLPIYGKTNNHIVLHGPMYGEALEALYKKCIIGVDVLGGHRKDYPISSSLKSREYAAYGLPVLTSSPIDYLDRNSAYQLILPYDDNPIDIGDVIRFYHATFDNNLENTVAKEIRQNAETRCGMKQTIMPIVEWIQRNCQ